MISQWRNPFDGGHPIGISKPDDPETRRKARRALASLVIRHGGTADDLRLMLDALRLWPVWDTESGITPL